MEPTGVPLSYGRVALAQPGSNCTSNSIIHVQRSQLGTCCHSTTAAAGSRLLQQRLVHTDQWLIFKSFLHAPVWRRTRTQCSGSGNRSVTKKDWKLNHRSVGSGRCRGSLDPAAAVVLRQHVPSCHRWTWMIELLAQVMTKWSAVGVSVWRRSRTQCSGSGNRSVTKKDWDFSHGSVGSGRCRGSLNPAAAVVLWQHVPSCDRWTWMIELLAQTIKTW